MAMATVIRPPMMPFTSAKVFLLINKKLPFVQRIIRKGAKLARVKIHGKTPRGFLGDFDFAEQSWQFGALSMFQFTSPALHEVVAGVLEERDIIVKHAKPKDVKAELEIKGGSGDFGFDFSRVYMDCADIVFALLPA